MQKFFSLPLVGLMLLCIGLPARACALVNVSGKAGMGYRLFGGVAHTGRQLIDWGSRPPHSRVFAWPCRRWTPQAGLTDDDQRRVKTKVALPIQRRTGIGRGLALNRLPANLVFRLPRRDVTVRASGRQFSVNEQGVRFNWWPYA